MKTKAFQLVKKLSYSTLSKNNIVECIDGKYYLLGTKIQVVYLTKELVDEYFAEIEVFKPAYKIMWLVKPINDEKTVGNITSFDCHTGLYTVRIKGESKTFKEEELVPAKFYWYVSSNGRVYRDVIGVDANAEAWRKNANNYFNTKETCEEHLKELKKEVPEMDKNDEVK